MYTNRTELLSALCLSADVLPMFYSVHVLSSLRDFCLRDNFVLVNSRFVMREMRTCQLVIGGMQLGKTLDE